jgi:3-oxoacyl-[acyl-carrier-protein] synthase-1
MNRPAEGPGVCVVGVGAATAVGETAETTAAAVRAAVPGFAEDPHMVDPQAEPCVVARATFVASDVTGTGRFLALAVPAALEAAAALRAVAPEARAMPAVVGLPAQRPGLPADLAPAVTARLKGLAAAGLTVTDVQVVATGHAAGLTALEEAGRRLRAGASFCLVGGVDSYIDPETMDWIVKNEQLHNPENAWGFIPGEAAGFCVLCTAPAAERFRLPVLARVLAAATAREENRIKTQTVCTGRGLTQAIRQALQGLPAGARVDYTLCDMNGEAYRADELGFTTPRVAERFVDAGDFGTPAACWGDVGAASGPLFVGLVTEAARKGYARGPHTLLWASSEGGERAAALLFAEPKPKGDR